MSEISFYKSKRDINLPDSNNKIQDKVTDSLYIIKDSNNRGRIYYDYDENTRIEIGSNDNVLYYNDATNNTVVIALKSKFNVLTSNGYKQQISYPFNELEVNKVVATPSSIYIIKQVGPGTDALTDNQVRMVKLYEPKKLAWTEYFTK